MTPSAESTSMEARYKLEVSNRDPSEIMDLNLDNCSASAITGLSDKLTNLQSLSIINAGLESLEGLPYLPGLVKLDLSNNMITDGLEFISKNCPALLHLNLSGNSIETVDKFEPFKTTGLCEIDIFSNPVTADETHRDEFFKLLPNLQILDGCDASGEEVPDEDDIIPAEDSDITDEEEGDEGDSEGEDGPGLSYLDKSQFSDDEEDDDYDPEAKKTRKREADDEEDEPAAKRNA